MAVLFSGVAWSIVVLLLLARALRQFRAYRQAALCSPDEVGGAPSVSMIVPARNEIDDIDLCLDGLRAQRGLSEPSTIIVVDDESQDGTVAAAAYHHRVDPRVRIVSAGPLPEGWAGKPHACWRGALLADSDWLCFVDADVRAAPKLVRAAVAAAEAQRIDMLSLQPLQELGSFWERTIMPAGLLVLACAKPFRTRSEDVVNGQFLLIRRAAYFNIGGHSAVRAEIAEDKALAERATSVGLTLRVLSAENFARTRMYRDFGSLWEGLSRQAPEILGGKVATLAAGVAALAFGWISLTLPPAVVLTAVAEPSAATITGAGLALGASAVVFGIQFATARHLRMPVVFGLSLPVGYTVLSCLAFNGVLASLLGRVRWKGRVYRLAKTTAQKP